MKKGMIFDLYQEGERTKRVMALNEKDVINLDNGEIIYGIDFENEVDEILLENIFDFNIVS